ncbi:MAG: hypothetical protein JEZ06_03565 [Anaerolineaceae bacterium]|nr:hypothetical protein [Anaerolineaceae bacterium]
MATLVFTYSPKEGVTLEELKKFLVEVDQPATLSLPSTISARILKVLGDETDFTCIELLEITSFDEWEADTKVPSPELQAVLDEWPKFGKMEEMKIYQCEEL